MTRKLTPILGLAAVMITGTEAARTETLRVTAVRSWSFEGATRIAIEVSGEFEYHAERLHNPERLFFDVYHARPWIGGRRAYSNTVGDKLVTRIRVAETQPGVARVVLDLAGSVDFTASQLANPDRLMIELRPGAAPAIPAETEVASLPPPPKADAVTPPSSAPPPLRPATTTPVVEPPARRLPPPPAVTTARKNPPPALAPPSAPPAVPPAPAETGRAAKPTSDGHSSLTRALGLKVTRVVIDPGHGGHDQGTVGPRGLQEKDLVLDVALRLGKLIEERMGSEVIYTRSDDTFIPLEGRTTLANDRHADLFISIHANSSPYPSIRGVETFYLNLTNAKDALDVAARENATSEKSIFELRDMIQKITMQDKAEESKEFATRVQASLQTFEHSYSPSAKNRGVKKAPFVVLIGASMPSILAEVGFISNPREEALLRRTDHRQKLAEALYRGVSRYAQSLSHFQVAQNQKDE